MTYKPNYNDGRWHAWSGGDCPVHPQSEIEAVYLMNDDIAESHRVFRNNASEKMWSHPFLFRVVKEYREPRKPREAWADEQGCFWDSKDEALKFGGTAVLFREVIE